MAIHQFNAGEFISDGPKHSGSVCCDQTSPCFSSFTGKWTSSSSQSQRRKGPSRLSSVMGAKANICPGIGGQTGFHLCAGFTDVSWRHLLGL